MVGEERQAVAAVPLREVYPVQDDVVLDVVPGGEVGVFQRAFADVERCVLIQRGGVEGGREEDVEVETVVVECPVVVVEAVLLAECPDADIVLPVDLQVETDLPFALAERDRLREGVRVDPAAYADALFQLVVAEDCAEEWNCPWS